MADFNRLIGTLHTYNRSVQPYVANLDKRKQRVGDESDFVVPRHHEQKQGSMLEQQRPNRAHHARYETRTMHEHQPQHHLPTNLLNIASAHRGQYIKDSLTVPRDNQGNLRTAIEISMGSFQAASDIVNTPIGVQCNSAGTRSMYHWPQKQIVQE